MNEKNSSGSRPAVWTLTAVLVMAILLNVFQFERVNALEAQVSATYQKAFFETVALMDSIGGNLEKMLISGSGSKEQELLAVISRQADTAQDNLSMLPASDPSISGSLKFVNQLGDYTSSLNRRLSAGGAVSDRDRELLMTLHTGCTELSGVLYEMSGRIQQGDNPFTSDAHVQEIAVPLAARTEPAVEFPSLLYDGPFSDGRPTDQLRALDSRQYTPEEAIELTKSFIGEDRILSVRLTGEGTTPVPCYELSAHVQEGKLDLAVTKQGGQVVYMICDEDPDEERFSKAELIDLAANFLRRNGYPQVSVSYWSLDDNLLTVNFAAMQEGVVLYPDLIKVQMSAESGLAVGFEALNYLANHTHRTALAPSLSEEEARSLLGPLLTVNTGRLCVIPTDAGEALCYEFSAETADSRYLIYIDAATGQEREIYRVIEDDDGQLVI